MSGLAQLKELLGIEAATAERLGDAARVAAERVEEARQKIAAAEAALVRGEVAPGPGTKAVAQAKAGYAAALADAESLTGAEKAAVARAAASEEEARRQAEAEREARIREEAAALDVQAEEALIGFLSIAERLTALRCQLPNGGAEYHVAALVGRVSRERARGAKRVLPVDVQPHGGLVLRLNLTGREEPT